MVCRKGTFNIKCMENQHALEQTRIHSEGLVHLVSLHKTIQLKTIAGHMA